jgi:hypothetical protein
MKDSDRKSPEGIAIAEGFTNSFGYFDRVLKEIGAN